MGVIDVLMDLKKSGSSIKEIFSSRLEILLDEFQLQKKDLAKEIGVSAVAITKYTKGLTLPSFEVLVSIANYFNVSADYLIGLVNEPVSEHDYVYFAPIGKLNYSFKISDSETLEGQLDYIFGLTVWNMELPKDETALNQFLCFKFSDNADNQRLYDCLFLTDELNVGYFLYKVSNQLGLPFMGEYQGVRSKKSQYLANLLVWNELGIKPPVGQMPLTEPQYLATLPIPTANEHIRLNYTFTSGAMPHLQVWMALTNQERRNLLMRRLRRIKKDYI